ARPRYRMSSEPSSRECPSPRLGAHPRALAASSDYPRWVIATAVSGLSRKRLGRTSSTLSMSLGPPHLPRSAKNPLRNGQRSVDLIKNERLAPDRMGDSHGKPDS